MSAGAGSLAISARRVAGRTILDRVRYDGISRCSRAFAHGDAALVVLSQLGPGVVRGDDVTTSGSVHPGAHLIVTNQAATRLMGGARPSRSQAHWSLDSGAVLELIGEPLIAFADARYDSSTTIELAAGAWVLVSELARVPAGAQVRLRTRVYRGAKELLYDAFDAGAVAPKVVGTFALLGVAAERIAPLVAAFDAVADVVAEQQHTTRVGVGSLAGGPFARILGNDLWAVRAVLTELREAAWRALRAAAVRETTAAEPQRIAGPA